MEMGGEGVKDELDEIVAWGEAQSHVQIRPQLVQTGGNDTF
jgi:hypothetical protein